MPHRSLAFRRMLVEQLQERAVLTALYINPLGGDDLADGLTAETAWKTPVNLAFRSEGADIAPRSYRLQPGDSINFVGAGNVSAATYYSGTDFGWQFLFLRDVHGTAEQPIVIRGIDFSTVSSVAPNGTEMSMIYILQSSHITVESLSLTGGYGSAIMIAASENVAVNDVSIREIDGIADNNLAGVHVVASKNITVSDSYIVDVYDRTKVGNPNNRPIVIFGSIDVSLVNNTLGYSEIGLGAGADFKHLGSLSAAEAAAGQFVVTGNVIENATEFGISSAAPNTFITNNLLINSSIQLADIGGTAQLANQNVIGNTIVSSEQGARTGSLYYVPTESAGFPMGNIAFEENLVFDRREYLTGETNTLEISRYGADVDYRRSIEAGLFRADRNVYATRESPRFDIFGADQVHNTVGGVYSFEQWQALGFDVHGATVDLELDEFFTPSVEVAAGWYSGASAGLSIVPASRAVSEDGTQRLRISRRGMANSAPLQVTVQTNAVERLSVPAVVTIPAGSSAVDIVVSGIPNDSPNDGRPVQIKVTAPGLLATTWLNLDDAPPPVGTSSGIYTVPGTGLTRLQTTLVVQDGEYRSELGLAIVDDEVGTVNGISPTEETWLRELLSNERVQTLVVAGSELAATTSVDIPAGSQIVFYMVQNASLQQWRTLNPSNAVSETPIVFASIASTNPGGFNHLRAEAGESWTLAWEDLLYGGDQNFTDMIAEIEFQASQEETLVRYTIGFSDVDGRPVEMVCVGDQFFVDVYVHDNRPTPQGIYSAALDVQYDGWLAEVVSPIVYGPLFPNYRTGEVSMGLIDEIGAAATLAGAESGSLVARIPMRASAQGTLTVSGNPADLPAHETTLLGIDDPIGSSAISYPTARLVIKPGRHWHNATMPTDVNRDGFVSPIDVLNIINFLNANGTATNLYSAAVDALFAGRAVDVNNDGMVSPLDALLVINWLNANRR